MIVVRILLPLLRFAAALILLANAPLAVKAATSLRAAPGEPVDFTITIVNPVIGGISEDSLSIGVLVSSTFELASVKAQVEGREVALAFSNNGVCGAGGGCTPGWSGALSLAGLSRGTKLLTITATDVFGAVGQAQRQFLYDRRPQISFSNPIAESVTGLTIRVTANCVDDDPAGCNSMRVYYQHPSFGPGTSGTILTVNRSSIDQDVALPANIKDFSIDGHMMLLGVIGTDSAGQTRGAIRTIYIQQHSRLVEVENFDGRILDIQPERVLLLNDPGTAYNLLTLRERANGQVSIVPLTGKLVIAGFLSPKGAIFVASDPSSTSSRIGRVYEWRDATLIDLGEIFTVPESGGLKVKGDFAIWDTYDQTLQGPTLLRRDLASGTMIEIARGANAGPAADLAANGDVVYTREQSPQLYDIYRYRGGTTSPLTNDAQDYLNGHPITDGINVVYLRKPRASPSNEHTVVLIDDGGARFDLTTIPRVLSPGEYQVDGSWVAFPRIGGGVSQIWKRSPVGELKQVSFFGTDSSLKKLSSNGELTLTNSGTRRIYLHRAGDPLLDVAAASALVTFSLGGQWYGYLGRTLFRLPTATELAPVLLTDGDTGRATALGSVTLMRDPFPFSDWRNFSTDRRTRVVLFARNVDWMSVNASAPLTAQAEDAQHRTFPLSVEYAAPNPIFPWLAEIILRLPDELSNAGDVWVTVNVSGLNSNRARINIGPGTP